MLGNSFWSMLQTIFPSAIHFEHAIVVAAGNHGVAVGEPDRAEHFGAMSFWSVAGRARPAAEIER